MVDSLDDIGAPLQGALFRYAVPRARGLPKTMLPQKYVHGQVAPLIRMGPPMEPMQHRGTTCPYFTSGNLFRAYSLTLSFKRPLGHKLKATDNSL